MNVVRICFLQAPPSIMAPHVETYSRGAMRAKRAATLIGAFAIFHSSSVCAEPRTLFLRKKKTIFFFSGYYTKKVGSYLYSKQKLHNTESVCCNEPVDDDDD